MTEPLRRSEEHPLLNPNDGGKPVLNKTPVIPIEWNVSCAPKPRSWIARWPQFVSACWISVVLLTILFVIFYGFGSIYRLQSMVMLKNNESKPTGEVFYHYLVPRDNYIPFKTFTNYLSFMATQYPQLNFNVHLLIDDTPQNSFYTFPSNSVRFKRFLPKYTGPISYVSIKSYDREITEFHKKHPSVNVSVMTLNKYTANTPLQFKWRAIPVIYLPFYVRVYEVWKNGGIGLNLLTENSRFNALKRIDFKLDAILKQHTKNVDLPKYKQGIDNIDAEDKRKHFVFLFDAFNEIPKMMFQIFFHFGTVSDNEGMHGPPMNSIKIKRSISSNKILENTTKDTKKNVSNINVEHNMNVNITRRNDSKAFNTTQIQNTTNDIKITAIKQNDSTIAKEHEYPNDAPLFHQVYELLRLTDVNEAFHGIIDVDTPDFHNKNNYKNYLTLNSDGSFVAAYSRNHPFVSKLLFTPKIMNYSPRDIISDNIQEKCFRSSYIHNYSNDYCDSIKILNSL